jgi:hypothetical protein
MNEYCIEGAESSTGEDVSIFVWAPNEEAARNEAVLKGIMVASVTLQRPRQPPQPYASSKRARATASRGSSTRFLLTSAIWASGVVSAIGYLWTLYAIVRAVSLLAQSGSTPPSRFGPSSPFRQPTAISPVDLADGLFFAAVAIAIPVMASVAFHCACAALAASRARLGTA